MHRAEPGRSQGFDVACGDSARAYDYACIAVNPTAVQAFWLISWAAMIFLQNPDGVLVQMNCWVPGH